MASLQQVSDEPQCRILVCGETTAGKSSLINFILGDNVCEVGSPGDLDVFPRTKRVQSYRVTVNGVLVTIYDSPGLLEGQSGEQECLTEMHERCYDVDLVFYCHDMTIDRWIPAEIDAIRLLTAKFGASFWNKAIFVLTRANMIQSPNSKGEEEELKCFQNRIISVTTRLQTEVKEQLQTMRGEHAEDDDQSEAGETQNLVDNIPVVPTGSAAKRILPGGKNFIGDLLVTCMQRIANPHLSEIFTQAMNDEEPLIDATEFDKDGHLYGFTSERSSTPTDLQCEVALYRKYIVRLCSSAQTETGLPLHLQLSEELPQIETELHSTNPSQIEQTIVSSPDSVVTQLPTTYRPSKRKLICHRTIIIGALVGAIAGSAFIPVLGTIIGAIVGAIIEIARECYRLRHIEI